MISQLRCCIFEAERLGDFFRNFIGADAEMRFYDAEDRFLNFPRRQILYFLERRNIDIRAVAKRDLSVSLIQEMTIAQIARRIADPGDRLVKRLRDLAPHALSARVDNPPGDFVLVNRTFGLDDFHDQV